MNRAVWIVLGTVFSLVIFNAAFAYFDFTKNESQVRQLGPNVSAEDIAASKRQVFLSNQVYLTGNSVIVFLGVVILFLYVNSGSKKSIAYGLLAFLALSSTGCRRPFEPVKLEVIKPHEEAFLIPLNDNAEKQQSSHTEEFLEKNLVYSQQVRIPQQWVPLGYETTFWNGEWRDAATLFKVDKSPVTKEWTADPNTGTSNKNEAIWVMTSDQVEFSTGWTCTARISSREDCIKFLANYPNGSLESVMDKEIRGKLQSTFGLAVTDLPMDELRKHATPHIVKTVKEVSEYFSARGITITNLGITGGFVYKDPKIISMMVELFNSEQKKLIAKQDAEAILTTRKAEADGIKLVADAKFYEMDKAQKDMGFYLGLKELELMKEKINRWDGKFPQYYIGKPDGLDLLLQTPTPAPVLNTTKKLPAPAM